MENPAAGHSGGFDFYPAVGRGAGSGASEVREAGNVHMQNPAVGLVSAGVSDGPRIGVARPPNCSPQAKAAVAGQQWRHTDDSRGWKPVVEVFNGSCWNTCKRRIAASDASVFLLAEVRLLPHQIAAARSWCRRRGFTALFEPAAASAVGGMPSGGVAIVAKAELGLVPACDLDTCIVPHRAVGGAIDVPTVGHVALVAVYLDVSDKWGSGNLALMAQVGACFLCCPTVLRWGGPQQRACDMRRVVIPRVGGQRRGRAHGWYLSFLRGGMECDRLRHHHRFAGVVCGVGHGGR